MTTTNPTCHRCDQAATETVTVLGGYRGRVDGEPQFSIWLEELCRACAAMIRERNERKEAARADH